MEGNTVIRDSATRLITMSSKQMIIWTVLLYVLYWKGITVLPKWLFVGLSWFTILTVLIQIAIMTVAADLHSIWDDGYPLGQAKHDLIDQINEGNDDAYIFNLIFVTLARLGFIIMKQILTVYFPFLVVGLIGPAPGEMITPLIQHIMLIMGIMFTIFAFLRETTEYFSETFCKRSDLYHIFKLIVSTKFIYAMGMGLYLFIRYI